MKNRLKIGVSSCLLGNPVRYDGGHKRDSYLADILSDYVEFETFCPETAIGLGVPRSTIQLYYDGEQTQLVDTSDRRINHTQKMLSVAAQQCHQFSHLSGYILKSRSPSCGMTKVPLHHENNEVTSDGVGLFAATLLQMSPYMPVEEEGRLQNVAIRENFIERLYAYNRWQRVSAEGLSVDALMQFHMQHKYTLLAHNEAVYRQLGRLVAETRKTNLTEQADHYMQLFTVAMQTLTTAGQHLNAMQHCMGYLKDKISAADKAELLELFEQYADGRLPLIVPLTLLRHYFRIYPNQYIDQQYYMNPSPTELLLRNHA